MNIKVKLVLYVVLLSLTAWCGSQFYKAYSAITKAEMVKNGIEPAAAPEPAAKAKKAKAETNAANLGTNAVGESVTNAEGVVVSSNSRPPEGGPATNSPAPAASEETTNPAATNSATNALSAANEAGTTTNSEPILSAATNSPPAPGTVAPAPANSTMVGYLGAFVGSLIMLGLLVAHDASQYFGDRSVDFIFNDKGEGMRSPEYEEAEQTWANGDHLAAIQMMREYLRKNPREQYVALRIAEIYEKDLRNYLAATLEYEEVLKQKIEPERWGWAAIHLCNLYSKTGKMDKSVALLRRIEAEYGETAAAEKARKRLALYDASGGEGLPPEDQNPPDAAG